jgi:hypothetical protein
MRAISWKKIIAPSPRMHPGEYVRQHWIYIGLMSGVFGGTVVCPVGLKGRRMQVARLLICSLPG